jgi:hypothetical protein
MLRRVILALAVSGISASGRGAAFTVTNANDSGAGSLRQAILDANGSAGPDTIQFAIPGSGVHTITLSTRLPSITQATTIDGFTQAGSSPNTLPFPQGTNTVLAIEISGQGMPLTLDAVGLTIDAGGAVIRGLAINRCYITGIWISDGAGDGIQILGNYIGTAPDGMSVPRGIGVTRQIRGVSAFGGVGHQIGPNPADRNLISGNNYEETNAEGQVIILVPTSQTCPRPRSAATSSEPTPRSPPRCRTGSASRPPWERTRSDGGSAAGEGNIVSGNANAGITAAPRGLCVIQGNIIGTDASGTRNLGNRAAASSWATSPTAPRFSSAASAPAKRTSSPSTAAGPAGIPLAWPISARASIASPCGAPDLRQRLARIRSRLGGADAQRSGRRRRGPQQPQNMPLITGVDYGPPTVVHATLNSVPSTVFDVDFYGNPAQ